MNAKQMIIFKPSFSSVECYGPATGDY